MRGFSNWEFRASRADQLPLLPPPQSMPPGPALPEGTVAHSPSLRLRRLVNNERKSQAREPKAIGKRHRNGKLITSCRERWDLLAGLALVASAREGEERNTRQLLHGGKATVLSGGCTCTLLHPRAQARVCVQE